MMKISKNWLWSDLQTTPLSDKIKVPSNVDSFSPKGGMKGQAVWFLKQVALQVKEKGIGGIRTKARLL